MNIRKKIDNSKLREESEKENFPIVDLLLRRIKDISEKEGHTILAVCPNSFNVVKAALRAAKRANAPIKFAATLNQVDIDGGYTTWTQHDFVRKIKEESYRIGYNGPIIVAVDHGGPWLKDIQASEKWGLDKCINWIKKTFEEALLAGYDLLHIDPTVDIFATKIKIETIVERTLDLIYHIEKFRISKEIKPISYEIGTEEVDGGLADITIFKKFLKLLKDGLKNIGLEYVWPVFIVAKVGTDLYTSKFDPTVAKVLVNITKDYGSYIKGHYTDFVSNPEDYPKSGMGAANVGPEFTTLEYDALSELCLIEDELYRSNKVGCRSNFKEILEKAVLKSNRWKKWLRDNEKDFDSLSKERKEWILKTSCRYVWAIPEVKCARMDLYRNLKLNGIDTENWVLMNIEKGMDKYFRAFNLININEKLDI